jgi:hypothetical protein
MLGLDGNPVRHNLLEVQPPITEPWCIFAGHERQKNILVMTSQKCVFLRVMNGKKTFW